MKIATTLLVSLASLAALPAAASAVPFGGYTAEQRPVTLNVSKDGRQIVLARTALDITCTDGSTDFAPDAWQKIPVSKSGSFSATFADQQGKSFDDKPMVSGGSITGKLNRRRGTVTGTWSIEHRITQPDGAIVTCSSGTVKYKAAAKSRSKGGFFGAFSSTDYSIVAQLANNARTVTSTRGTFELKCSKGGYRFVSDGWVKLPVSKSGKFKASVNGIEEKFSDGTTYKVSSSISGSVDRSGKRLKGTWTLRWEIPEADGVTDICESGTVRFSVKR